MKQNVNLEFLPEYNAYGISDEQMAAFAKEGITPILQLSDEDYAQLANKKPHANQPIVGFLMGREKGYYTIDMPYAKAIAQSCVQLRFLTYNENLSQMDGINGLILPGGAFDSPNEFYTDPQKGDSTPGTRSYAYITSIMKAEKEGIPMLGICAGAQMIGGMHGMKMYRDLKAYTNTSLEHKTKDLGAHNVFIYPNTPLAKILGEGHIETNSRHREAMMPNDKISDLKIYASTADGTPEAWGNEDKNILCIQWHPEDFAAQGDTKMQKIYDWLAEKALQHKQMQMQKQRSWQKKSLISR